MKIKNKKKNKKAQEEIAGFMIIVTIVSIILLFFLVFSLSSDKSTKESYKASSFLQATLDYTSACEKGSGFLTIDKLILACYDKQLCYIGDETKDACDVLNETLNDLLEMSWPIGEDRPEKGYKMEAISDPEERIFSILKGNVTDNYFGAQQVLPVSGAQIKVYFTVYH